MPLLLTSDPHACPPAGRGCRIAHFTLVPFLLVACGGPESSPPHEATADHEIHWDYAQLGPADWATLSSEFAACGVGERQSPIDIGDAVPAPVPALSATFRPAELHIVHHEHRADIINTGHSVQVNYPESDTLVIGDERFELLQYHFHTPSEHRVAGREFPAEVHFVHRAADGRLAVIGVLIEEGEANPAYEPVWQNLPSEKGREIHLEHVTVDVDALLPRETASVRYVGSLTTPPCSEGVEWIVMTTPVSMSGAQLAALRAVLSGNNRPIQPRHDRPVLRAMVPELDAH